MIGKSNQLEHFSEKQVTRIFKEAEAVGNIGNMRWYTAPNLANVVNATPRPSSGSYPRA